MKSLHRFVLIAALLPLSWLGMMAVHELGHVLAALAIGGKVERVVLHPLAISRTDLVENPRPLIVVWAGPIMGSLLPLALWLAAHLMRSGSEFLFRFFTGFCAIANGAYIGAGSFGRLADAGEMLRHGTPIWLLWAFGVAGIAIGLVAWNGLAPRFGIGKNADTVRPHVAYLVAGLAAITVALACWLDLR